MKRPQKYSTDPQTIKQRLTAKLIAANCIVPDATKNTIVAFVQEQMGLQRNALADVAESVAGFGDQATPEHIETLALLIRNHYVDEHGTLRPQER